MYGKKVVGLTKIHVILWISVAARTKPFIFTCTLRHLPKLVDVVNREDELHGREEERTEVEPEADVEEA